VGSVDISSEMRNEKKEKFGPENLKGRDHSEGLA
jgi:hypothetical protein